MARLDTDLYVKKDLFSSNPSPKSLCASPRIMFYHFLVFLLSVRVSFHFALIDQYKGFKSKFIFYFGWAQKSLQEFAKLVEISGLKGTWPK